MYKQYHNVSCLKNEILMIGIDENDQRVAQYVKYKPSVYTRTKDVTDYKDLYGHHVDRHKLDGIYDFFKVVRENQGVGIFGNINPQYQFIADYFDPEIKADHSKINILGFDIEVLTESGEFPYVENSEFPITSIVLESFGKDTVYVLSYKTFDLSKFKLPENIKILRKKCDDEEQLLKTFIKIMRKEHVDILLGWNSNNFDIPYIINRCKLYGLDQKLSPYGGKVVVRTKLDKINNRIEYVPSIQGVSCVDMMQLYKKFKSNVPRESYSLDYISEVELGHKKVEYEEYSLFKLAENNFDKFIYYNIIDVRLLSQLETKLNLVKTLINLSYLYKCNFEDAVSTILPWDCLIHYELYRDNIIIPPKKMNAAEVEFPGAYVHPPTPGIFNNIVTNDLTSLYPHVIMQYNISPETLIKNKKVDVTQHTLDERLLTRTLDLSDYTKDYIVAANGRLFSKEQIGIIPKLVDRIFQQRKITRNIMSEKEQEIEKIKNILATK